MDVEGEVWVAEGQKNQTTWRFLARIPQKLLYRKIREFDYQIEVFDLASRYFVLDVTEIEQQHERQLARSSAFAHQGLRVLALCAPDR